MYNSASRPVHSATPVVSSSATASKRHLKSFVAPRSNIYDSLKSHSHSKPRPVTVASAAPSPMVKLLHSDATTTATSSVSNNSTSSHSSTTIAQLSPDEDRENDPACDNDKIPSSSAAAGASTSCCLPTSFNASPSEWLLALQSLPKHPPQQVVDSYAKAMRSIDYKKYKDDGDLVRIWLQFIQIQISNGRASYATVNKFFNQMRTLAIGKYSSAFYLEWARYEVDSDKRQKAVDILDSGLALVLKCDAHELVDMKSSILVKDSPPVSAPVVPFDQHTQEMSVIVSSAVPPANDNIETIVASAEVDKAVDVPVSAPITKIEQVQVETSALPVMASKKSALLVNKTAYAKLELLGRGGSSKVFKVLAPNGKIYALKRVGLKGIDESTLSGYVNEIALLKRMESCDRIINLHEFEINKRAGYLHMVMECGEIDLAHVLADQKETPINLNFIRVYWEQMLEAVHAIHEERVVHSDLKPANFLFVKGALKLIDFGIAKAIQNDTTNIHRDHQVGTVNYMSPEAIMDTNAMKEPNSDGSRTQCMKLGRASDVWSLGCILYQMVYGKPPFSHLAVIAKLQKIIDPKHPIEYPALDEQAANPFLIAVMKSCLQRDPKKRMTIPELLTHPFLKPDAVMQKLMNDHHHPLKNMDEVVRMTRELLLKTPSMTTTQLVDTINSMRDKSQ
eukprot:Partr_v1_DN25938_c0_g1_i2_m68724 putative ttk protein kinase